MTRSDDPVVRAAIHDNLLVHPRIVQQGGGPGPEQRAA